MNLLKSQKRNANEMRFQLNVKLTQLLLTSKMAQNIERIQCFHYLYIQ